MNKMRRYLYLAALMAALVLLAVSTSFAQEMSGPVTENGVPIPGFENAGTTASQAVKNDPEVSNMVESLKPVEQQLANAETQGDQNTIDELQPQVVEQVDNIVVRINQITQKSLTRADGIVVMTKLGIWGPTSNWAKSEVAEAYATGRMVGDHDGATAADEQGGRPASRQDLATVGNRVAREGARNLNTHAKWDTREHQALWAAIINVRQWNWIIPACLAALALLILLGIISRRRRRQNNNGLGNQAGWAQQGNGVTASALNLSAAGETRSLGRN